MSTSGLAKFLLKDGVLSSNEYQLIAKDYGGQGPTFAKVVVAMGIMSEQQLANFIAAKTKLPFIKDKKIYLNANIVAAIDLPLVENLEILPLAINGKVLSVAMADPLDKNILSQLAFFTSYKINPQIVTLSCVWNSLLDFVNDFKPLKTNLEQLLHKRIAHAGSLKRTTPAPIPEITEQQAKSHQEPTPAVDKEEIFAGDDLSVPEDSPAPVNEIIEEAPGANSENDIQVEEQAPEEEENATTGTPFEDKSVKAAPDLDAFDSGEIENTDLIAEIEDIVEEDDDSETKPSSIEPQEDTDFAIEEEGNEPVSFSEAESDTSANEMDDIDLAMEDDIPAKTENEDLGIAQESEAMNRDTDISSPSDLPLTVGEDPNADNVLDEKTEEDNAATIDSPLNEKSEADLGFMDSDLSEIDASPDMTETSSAIAMEQDLNDETLDTTQEDVSESAMQMDTSITETLADQDLSADLPMDDLELSMTDPEPADDLPADDLPVDDLPVDDLPADDLPADDLPADDLPADDLPADDLPADDLIEPLTDQAPTENLPMDDLELSMTEPEPADDLPADDSIDDTNPAPSEVAENASQNIAAASSGDHRLEKLSIGYLNHAAAMTQLAFSSEKAQIAAENGLIKAGIKKGAIYAATTTDYSLLTQWKNAGNLIDDEITEEIFSLLERSGQENNWLVLDSIPTPFSHYQSTTEVPMIIRLTSEQNDGFVTIASWDKEISQFSTVKNLSTQLILQLTGHFVPAINR